MKRPDLDAIERRAQAATPGPWVAHESVVVTADRRGRFVCDAFCDAMGEHNPDANADAALIAAARTDVPALCAYVQQLEAELVAERKRNAQPCTCIYGWHDRTCGVHGDRQAGE